MAKSRKLVGLVAIGVSVIGLGGLAAMAAINRPSEYILFSAPGHSRPFSAALGATIDKEVSDWDHQFDVEQMYSSSAYSQVGKLKDLEGSDPDALVLSPVDEYAAETALDFLHDAQVPVVSVGCFPNFPENVVCVTPDYEAGGIQAADAIAEAIGEAGSVILIQPSISSATAPEIRDGLRKGFAKYPDVNLVEQYSTAEGLEHPISSLYGVAPAIKNIPDVKAVFGEDDLVAIDAIQDLVPKAGEDIVVFGFGGTPEALGAIKRGTMLGTIDLQPEQVGVEAAKQVRTILDGQTPKSEKRTPVVKVDASNIDEYDITPLLHFYAAFSSLSKKLSTLQPS